MLVARPIGGNDDPTCGDYDERTTTSAQRGVRSALESEAAACGEGERGLRPASVGAEELGFRLRKQTECGHPESAHDERLVAYLDGAPVGWCAI